MREFVVTNWPELITGTEKVSNLCNAEKRGHTICTPAEEGAFSVALDQQIPDFHFQSSIRNRHFPGN